MKIRLNNTELNLECNAYSPVIYEDTFKGRNFLKDYEKSITEPTVSTHIRFLWCFAKTADNSIDDFETFSRSKDILENITDVINTNVVLITKSLTSSIPKKKKKARKSIFSIIHPAKS